MIGAHQIAFFVPCSPFHATRRNYLARKYKIYPDGFWSSPPINPKRKGDASVIMIYCAVGEALTHWEEVEEALLRLYTVFLKCKDADQWHVIKRSFGAVESNAVRRAMIEAAAEIYFSHDWDRADVHGPFKALMDAVRLASYIRNEIAHGKAYAVTAHRQEADGTPTVINTGGFLFAPEYMTARQLPFLHPFDQDDPLATDRSRYRYTSEDIRSFANKFRHIKEKIEEYFVSVQLNEQRVPKNVMKIYLKEAEERRTKSQPHKPSD